MTGNPGNDGPSINAVVWVLFALCVFSAVLRLIARSRHRQQLSWNDYVMFIALV